MVSSAHIVDRHWVDVLAIPLLMANVSRYMTGTDKARPNAFELVGMDSTSSGIIICDDAPTLEEWLQSISDNIAALNAQTLAINNKGVSVGEYIFHVSWVGERIASSRTWPIWRPRFLAIKVGETLESTWPHGQLVMIFVLWVISLCPLMGNWAYLRMQTPTGSNNPTVVGRLSRLLFRGLI